MSITKQEITRSAKKLFKERGFLSTTIQNVAEDCGIAKGSVYKFFPSKEYLFSEVFDQCQNVYFDKAKELACIQGLSKEQHFLQQINFRFQYFTEYKFILVEFSELPIQQDPKFHPLRLSVRGRLIRWHMECLKNYFGEEINRYLLDLVSIFRAMLKEYLFWIIYEEGNLSFEKIAQFILDNLKTIAQHMITHDVKPLLKEDNFKRYINYGLEKECNDKDQILCDILKKIEFAINNIPSGESHRLDLRELLNFIKTETKKLNYNKPLTQAALYYLKKENELKSLVIQLSNIMNINL